MNRRPLNSLALSKVITSFINFKTAEGLSERSVDSYRRILEHWAEFAGIKKVVQITENESWRKASRRPSYRLGGIRKCRLFLHL
jgi:hypothetical protein